MKRTENKRLFFDIETTGLDEHKGHILEVAAAVTDGQLNLIQGATFHALIKPEHPDWKSEMNDWVRKTHTQSGLLADVDSSGLRLADVDLALASFVSKHFAEQPLLAGNSVHFDKGWAKAHLPSFHKDLFYRIGDVSSVYEFIHGYFGFEKSHDEPVHRAMADVLSSIDQARNYMELFRTGLSSKK
jgi:oligoribonuclease